MEEKQNENVFDPAKSGIDPRKLLLGLVYGKNKKGKTKCQQVRKHGNPYRDQCFAPKGYTVRQVSRLKFIVTAPEGATLLDFKRKTVKTIEKDSRIGRRFAK